MNKQDKDRFADFLIEHYESQKEVERLRYILEGKASPMGSSVTLFAMIYNYGARFKCQKALDYFNTTPVTAPTQGAFNREELG